MGRQGLRPPLSLFGLSLSPESDGDTYSENDYENGDDDGSSDTSFGDTTGLGGSDIVKDTVGRLSGSGGSSVGLDGASIGNSGEHGGSGIVDCKDRSRGRLSIP
jgi:hypothetical protein